MGILILGAGGAGLSAVQAIRSTDKKIDVNLASVEDCMPYSLCGLPDFLSGEISYKVLRRSDIDFFNKNKIDLIFGKEAIKVDPSRKIVYFNNKSTDDFKDKLEFDKLLIAIGSKPIVPSICGLNKKQVFVVSNLEICKNIIKGLSKAKKIAIIGGGFVGIECAQALRKRKKEVIVIESLDHILANIFDKEMASIAQGILESIGIDFNLGNQVEEIVGDDVVEGLKFRNGEIDCDMVLLTIGSRPNIDIIRGTKIKVNQGILVNEFMESNVKDIFAAGDVAESFDCINGAPGLKQTWSNAVEQGWVAGLNIAGKICKYSGFQSYNVVHINDIPFLSMGNVTNLPQDCLELVSKGIDSMRKIFIKNNRILGMEFFGDITNSGYLFTLLNKGLDINDYKEKILSNYFHNVRVRM